MGDNELIGMILFSKHNFQFSIHYCKVGNFIDHINKTEK